MGNDFTKNNGDNVSVGPDMVSPPELSNIKTVERKEDVKKLGTLGMELAREFSDADGPAFWIKMDDKRNSVLVEVRPESSEYKQALRHFNKTCSKKVIKIQRVQNKYLWRRFLSKKLLMLSKNKGEINERVLFHGTRTTKPEKVCHGKNSSGFDPRLGTGYYGAGAYFASDAIYSATSYAYAVPSTSHKQIFLAKVLCGVEKDFGMAKSNSLKRAPNLPTHHPLAPGLYDSVCGGPHPVASVKSKMYVVYDSTQAYPLYLITYNA